MPDSIRTQTADSQVPKHYPRIIKLSENNSTAYQWYIVIMLTSRLVRNVHGQTNIKDSETHENNCVFLVIDFW